jgi:hypothetical protein
MRGWKEDGKRGRRGRNYYINFEQLFNKIDVELLEDNRTFGFHVSQLEKG